MNKLIVILLSVITLLSSCNTTNENPDFVEGQYSLKISGDLNEELVGDARFDFVSVTYPTPFDTTVITLFIVLNTSESSTELPDNFILSMESYPELGLHKYCLDDFLDEPEPCLDETGTFGIRYAEPEKAYFLRSEINVLESSENVIKFNIEASGRANDEEGTFEIKGNVYAIPGEVQTLLNY